MKTPKFPHEFVENWPNAYTGLARDFITGWVGDDEILIGKAACWAALEMMHGRKPRGPAALIARLTIMAQGDELTREEVEATLKWLEEWEKVNEDKRYTLFEKYYMERASRRRRNKGHHR